MTQIDEKEEHLNCGCFPEVVLSPPLPMDLLAWSMAKPF
jgi:hypothetical protein